MKNQLSKKELWLKIKNYHFEGLVPTHLWDELIQRFGGIDASQKAFAHKIARKLDWPTDFAEFAIAEYKKFVFLGIAGDFTVTPSKIIDQVWHEHILFSKGYRDFCNNVICYDFDHNPELLPGEEQTKIFTTQYLNTLALYKAEFNTDPPEAVWSTAKFDKKLKRHAAAVSRNKKETRNKNQTDTISDGGTPLFECFDGMDGLESSESMGEFGGFGGGDFSGGGASESYADASDSFDSGGGDSGGDSSCSSCSSGCGGGD